MKNYVISGSLGNISRPIVVGLVKAGKQVTVITSTHDKVKEIESLGANALVGSLTDSKFLVSAFKGAEVVYTMIPPIWKTDNWRASQREMVTAYVAALKETKVPYIVNLSSLGAHLTNGCGPVSGLNEFENQLNELPGLKVKHLRPGYFYYNFVNQIGMIKSAGIMGGNFGGDGNTVPIVHPKDVATVALEELLNLNFTGHSVRNIVGELLTGAQIATTLGSAVDKSFPWVVFTDEDQSKGLLGAGLSKTHTEGYVEMGLSLRQGKFQEDLLKQTLALAPTKLADFKGEFAGAFAKA